MELTTYEVEAAVENHHWWFWGRRKLFTGILNNTIKSKLTAKVLDIGTSTGTNLRLFRDMGFTNVGGLDASSEAVRYCREKNLGEVTLGDICKIPFQDESYDLVFATDVIEHVDDDVSALKEVYRILKPGGYALVTAPAFLCLWGLQDDVSLHKRRYRLNELKQKCRQANFDILSGYYFNYFLFFPIWLMRIIIRALGIRLKSENQINNSFINFIMKGVFYLDVKSAAVIHPPIGVSALVVLRKMPNL